MKLVTKKLHIWGCLLSLVALSACDSSNFYYQTIDNESSYNLTIVFHPDDVLVYGDSAKIPAGTELRIYSELRQERKNPEESCSMNLEPAFAIAYSGGDTIPLTISLIEESNWTSFYDGKTDQYCVIEINDDNIQ